jgi:hypothetical protein
MPEARPSTRNNTYAPMILLAMALGMILAAVCFVVSAKYQARKRRQALVKRRKHRVHINTGTRSMD